MFAPIYNSNPNPSDDNTTIECTILDALNVDCWKHIFSYVPIKDIIRSERVSKRWSCVVNEYLSGYSTFKMSWWPGITKEMLYRLLIRLGASLKRLYIDDRSNLDLKIQDPHRFCDKMDILPNLEELTYHYNNYYYLRYLFRRSSKSLKSISLSLSNLYSSYMIPYTDTFLYENVDGSSIEKITLMNDAATGSFLAVNKFQNIKYLAFSNCMGLDRFNLERIEKLFNLTTLKIDHCPMILWKSIPKIISSLTQLQVLSLSDYSYYVNAFKPRDLKSDIEKQFCLALSKLSSLKHLNLSKNSFVTNSLIKQIAQTCKILENLDISHCNGGTESIDDEAVLAVSEACEMLRELNVSHLRLSEAGTSRLKKLTALRQLTVKYTR